MADINHLIPFLLKWEAGINPAGLTPEQVFEKARRTGYADDPDDRGGATMCGVTIATYTEYCHRKGYPEPTVGRLRNLTFAQWRDILKTLYWDRWQADRIVSQSVAEILVDWVWASGKHGITNIQRMLGLNVDGIVGPRTLAAVNAQPPGALFERIRRERILFVDRIIAANPRQAKWRKGWLNRINDIKFTS